MAAFLNNKIVKNFSYLTISNFINQGILVFSGIKIARTLGPAMYGIYTYLFVEIAIYAAIGELGLRNIIIRTIARHPEKATSTFLSSITIQLLGLGLATLIMLIYEHFTHSVNSQLIIFIILAVCLSNLWATCECVWQGHQRMGTPALINVSTSLIWIAFILITPSSYFTVEFLFKYYCYYQIIQVGLLIVFTFCTKGILKGKIGILSSSSWKLLKESSPYYLNNMMTLPTSSLSNNFLERNSTKQQLGYFNTSNRLISPIRLVINLGLSAIFPKISSLALTNRDELLRKITLGFPILLISLAWLCFCFAMLSKELIVILYGIKYLPSVQIMQFQIWFILIFALNCFIGTVWGATDNQKLVAKYGIVNSIIATPFLWFGSKYGGLGLANSYLLAYALFFPFLFYLFQKSLNLKIKLTKEVIIVVGMFSLTALMPADLHVLIRLCLIVIILLTLVKVYYKIVKENFVSVSK